MGLMRFVVRPVISPRANGRQGRSSHANPGFASTTVLVKGRNKLIEILFSERGRQEGITKKNFANALGQIACKPPFRNVAGSPRGKRG